MCLDEAEREKKTRLANYEHHSAEGGSPTPCVDPKCKKAVQYMIWGRAGAIHYCCTCLQEQLTQHPLPL